MQKCMKIMGSFYKIHNQTLHIIIILPPNFELIVLKISLFYFLSMTSVIKVS